MVQLNSSLPLWVQIVGYLGNFSILIYNFPQIYKTIKTKSTKDISCAFLIIRVLSSILWLIYSSYTMEYFVLLSWIITGSSTVIILYYKFFYSNSCCHCCLRKKNNSVLPYIFQDTMMNIPPPLQSHTTSSPFETSQSNTNTSVIA